jgi:hypothetical protein
MSEIARVKSPSTVNIHLNNEGQEDKTSPVFLGWVPVWYNENC